MTKFVSCLTVLLVAGSLANAKERSKSAGTSASAEQKIIDLEKSLWEAWKNKDGKPFEAALAPDFREDDSSGSYDRAAAIAAPKSCEVKGYSLSDWKTMWLGKNAALITFKANMHATCSGQQIPENVGASSVYVKQNGKWLEAYHSEVPQSAGH